MPAKSSSSAAKPFLKWPGGKFRLVPFIAGHLPVPTAAGRRGRLIEPFAGSGAVFSGLAASGAFDGYVLADANSDLITVYRALAEEPEAFIAACRALFTPANNAKDAYRVLRARFNALPVGSRERAVLMVYLNRHGYNGLWRVNSKGAMNVAFGACAQPYFPETELRAFADRLADNDVQLVHGDFRAVMAMAEPSDTVYADPPYLPAGDGAAFTAYAAGGFSDRDQRDLAEAARACARRGVTVLISNTWCDSAVELYRDVRLVPVEVSRSISCRSSGRGKVREVLAVFDAVRAANSASAAAPSRPIRAKIFSLSAAARPQATARFTSRLDQAAGKENSSKWSYFSRIQFLRARNRSASGRQDVMKYLSVLPRHAALRPRNEMKAMPENFLIPM